MPCVPYRVTAIFDATSLPAALTREHRTKASAWGVVRVLEGAIGYRVLGSPNEERLTATHPGYILPEEPHLLVPEPGAAFRLQVEFYDHDPRASET